MATFIAGSMFTPGNLQVILHMTECNSHYTNYTYGESKVNHCPLTCHRDVFNRLLLLQPVKINQCPTSLLCQLCKYKDNSKCDCSSFSIDRVITISKVQGHYNQWGMMIRSLIKRKYHYAKQIWPGGCKDYCTFQMYGKVSYDPSVTGTSISFLINMGSFLLL